MRRELVWILFFLACTSQYTEGQLQECSEVDVIYGASDVFGSFFDAAAHGLTQGCRLGDCTHTDAFIASSIVACALICSRVPDCEVWSFAGEPRESREEIQVNETGQCWFRVSAEDRAHSEGIISGHRSCQEPVENELAVCYSGQVRDNDDWGFSQIGPMLHRLGTWPLIFAVMPQSDCEKALSRLSKEHVWCIRDRPLSEAEQNFVDYGPHVSSTGKDAHVLYLRLLAGCGSLIKNYMQRTGEKIRWVLRIRADIQLSAFPATSSLPAQAIFVAYRTKDIKYAGMNDKLMLGPLDMMLFLFEFYNFTIDTYNWEVWTTLIDGARVPITSYRRYVTEDTHMFSENLLHCYLHVHNFPVMAHRGLLYDRFDVNETLTFWPPRNKHGIFDIETQLYATGATSEFSNAMDMDIFLLSSLVAFFDSEIELLGRRITVLDLGCGQGDLVLALITAQVIAIGVDGADAHIQPLGSFGIIADLTESLHKSEDLFLRLALLQASPSGLNHSTGLHIPDRLEGIVLYADWIVSIDVGSYIPSYPPELREMFLDNLLHYCQRGFILRWGKGPHRVRLSLLTSYIEARGFVRRHELEQTFSYFSGVLGPALDELLVYQKVGSKPDIVVSHPIPPTEVLLAGDPFHTSCAEIYVQGEILLVIGYIRLLRAYLQPWNRAVDVLAPLRRPFSNAVSPQNGLPWANLTWEELARSVWDITPLLRLLLHRSPDQMKDIVYGGIEQVAWLREERLRLNAPINLPMKYFWEDQFESPVQASSDTEWIVQPTFCQDIWLGRLRTRFWSG